MEKPINTDKALHLLLVCPALMEMQRKIIIDRWTGRLIISWSNGKPTHWRRETVESGQFRNDGTK